MTDSRITLVTGATGVAGRHIADVLEERGATVLRVSRQPAPRGLRADITDPSSIDRLPHFTGVVHCAGLTPRQGATGWADFERINVAGSALLAEQAVKRGARFFVYISTAGRLGRRDSSIATRLYVLSKYLAERRIRQIVRDRVPALSLRAASLYGEHDQGSMSRLIRAIARGRFLLPIRGDVPKCLLYAGSLARVVADEIASERLRGWRARPIADPRSYTLAEIVATIESAVGRSVLRVPVSPRLMCAGAATAESVARRLGRSSLSELAYGARIALTPAPCRPDNLLGDHPAQHVGLAEGVKREVEWMRATGTL